MGAVRFRSVPTVRHSSGLQWIALLIFAAAGVACADDQAMDVLAVEGAGAAGGAESAGFGALGASAGRRSESPRTGPAGSAASAGPAEAGRSGANAARPGARTAQAGAAGVGAVAAAAGGSGGASGSAAVGGAGTTGGAAAAGSGGGVAAAGSGGASGAAAYAPCPMDDVCKILPLGDSITYGIGFDGGYRVELFKSAHSAGKKITFTGSLSNGPSMVDGVMFPRNNEGHSGWKINQLLPLIPMPALQTPPHIVLLMIGTNDIAQNDDLANAPKRLGALLDKLAMSAPDALIVLATLIPMGSSKAVETYNAALPDLVSKRAAAGMHIQLIDQFKGFPTSELGDGVHPNQQGYKRMAGVWFAAISELLR